MAFPTVASPTTTTFSTSVTSMAVNMPASIAAGDLLIACVGVRNAGTWTPPSGWTLLNEQAGGGAVGESGVWWKIADGTEGSTVSWTAGTATTAAWHVFKVTGWHGTAAPEFVSNNGDSVAVNPGSLTPSWGAADTLWIAFVGSSANGMSFTGAPASYTNLTSTTASSGGGASNAGSATRQLNATSEDPGAFTTSQNRWWASFTIAVRPAAASTILFSDGFESNDFSAWANDTTGSIATTSTQAREGTYSARVNPSASTGFVRKAVFGTNQTGTVYARVYVYLVSAATVATQFIRWSNTSNAQMGFIRLNTDRTLSLIQANGSTQIGSASSALSLNTWHCVELKISAPSNPGTLEARLNGSVFASGNNNVQGSFARLLIGAINPSTSVDVYFDSIVVDDTAYPGPLGGSTGQIKVWNGSAWVAKPVKVWNGSAWVVKPAKRWNGTAWVVTPY